MSNSLAGDKSTSGKATHVCLRPRRDSAKSVDTAVRVEKIKRKQKRTENQQKAKCDFIHSWLKQSEKLSTQRSATEIKQDGITFQIQGVNALSKENTDQGATCDKIALNSWEQVSSFISTDDLEKHMADKIESDLEHQDYESSSHASPPKLVPIATTEAEKGAQLRSPESLTKTEQRFENMIQKFKERYDNNDQKVVFEMFESTLRRVLNVQKTVIEVKKTQESLDGKLQEIKTELKKDLCTNSAKIGSLVSEKEILDLRIDKVCEQMQDISSGVIFNESKLDNLKYKVGVIETGMNKGTMTLKNLEDDTEGADVKGQIDQFIKDKLQIREGLDLISAYRIGKIESGTNRPVRFKLLDPNDVAIIFQNIENLKGVKNGAGEAYNLSEHLTERDLEIKNHYRDLKQENRNLPALYQKDLRLKNNQIKCDGKKVPKMVNSPTLKDSMYLTDDQKDDYSAVKMWEGETLEVETSKFTAYAIETDSFEVIRSAYKLLRNRHLKAAHIMCGYRLFGKSFPTLQNYSDDGEYGGGRAILGVLKEQKLFNTAVFVVRYRDHINIGSKRFDAIRDATTNVLAEIIPSANRGQMEQDQKTVKALNDAAYTFKPKYRPAGIRGRGRGGGPGYRTRSQTSKD